MAPNSEQLPPSGIRREIEVASPPDDVWEVLVDDDERGAWFGGRTAMDPSPGGTGWFEDEDGTRRWVRVDEAEPGRRLAWIWSPEPTDDDAADEQPDGASRVEIDLTPLPGGTRVAVTETPLTPVAQASALTTRGGALVDLELRLMVRITAAVVLART